MKVSTVILPILAIAIFTGVSNAQRVIVSSGSDQIPLTPVSITSGPQAGPNIHAYAGQTARIQVLAVDPSEASFTFGFPLSASVCTEGMTFSRPASGSPGGKLFVGTDQGVYNVPTNPAWKGGCRILSVRLRDGSEHIGRIFFH